MEFSIAFDRSGDTIPFVSQNPAVVEYYVDHISKLNCNQFSLINSKFSDVVGNYIDDLHSKLIAANQWMNPLFDCKFPIFAHDEYLDQTNLSFLHAYWVKLHSYKYDIDRKRIEYEYQGLAEQIHEQYPDDIRFPTLSDVSGKLGKIEDFRQINEPLIHNIESSFNNITYGTCSDWIEIPNVFEKNIINFDICNLWLPFAHLGRFQFDRFINDHDLLYDDENTFNELLKFVSLGLQLPQTVHYSDQYIEWCNKHNKVPTGNRIPLGNIPDLLTNLKRYRILVYKNAKAGNTFQINLHKG